MSNGNAISNTVSFIVENIENDQKLFYRIHEIYIDKTIKDDKKKIKPSAFDPQPKKENSVQMSVNWEKYIDADRTRLSHRKPDKIGVVSFVCGIVRNNPIDLKVTHAPTSNQAHSHIHDVVSDIDDPEIRIRLRDICIWEITI